jgi:hypothetical protein
LKLRNFAFKFLHISLLIVATLAFTAGSFVIHVKAASSSSYYYQFTVNRQGFTDTEINFSSVLAQGSSWVFVPRAPVEWNYTVTKGTIGPNDLVETDQVVQEKSFFYQAFRFQYQAAGTFNMTIRFGFDNGAMIIEPRGVFYSPQIGFKSDSSASAEVDLDNSFQIKPSLAIVVGRLGTYPETDIQGLTKIFFNIPQTENQVRVQLEFTVGFQTPDYTTLTSKDNRTFTFNSVTRYNAIAQNILNVYDRIYPNFTRLFNTTLDSVNVQFFLPDFESLLSVGGYVPLYGGQLGEININVFFARAVNGTIEVIAAHELVHRFIGKTGVSASNFLWFHEGMAQFISITELAKLNYLGATQQKDNLDTSASNLISNLGGEDFGLIQLEDWTPNYQPQGVTIDALYTAAYYVVSQLPQVVHQDGFAYYGRFFKVIHGSQVNDINVLSMYLSTAANASVALTLQRWGFSVTDLYKSPLGDLIAQAGKAVQAANPIFQPYQALAESFYQQGLVSAQQGDWGRAQSFLQLSIGLANLAPVLFFLTILAVLGLLAYIFRRYSRRPKPPGVPVPPQEILQPPTQV